jgi:carbon starvation protein
MLLESLVAIMAMIAACTLDPGVYMSVNYSAKGANVAEVTSNTVAKVNSLGPEYAVSADQMDALAKQIGETTLVGRTGGAATLAVGMAHIFSRAVHGRWLDIWYHFAIMFEALFILTTLDAGTRVGRYLLHDALGAIWRPLGNTKSIWASLLTSVLIVAAWGYFLMQGVHDPNGGVKALWPIFGIANQMLAGIALCLATTVILKMQLTRKKPQLGYVLVTLLPLAWLLTVTLSASVQKIFNPKAGFLALARGLGEKLPALEQAAAASGATAADKQAVTANLIGQFNNRVDAAVVGLFIIFVTAILALSLYEWVMLLARKRIAELRETAPVWIADYETATRKPMHLAGWLVLGFALLKEFTGEAAIERTRVESAQICECGSKEHRQLYVAFTTRKFKGVNRCC